MSSARLLLALLVPVLLGTGCGSSNKALIARQQHQIDSLTVRLDTLTTRLLTLDAERRLLTARLDTAQTRLARAHAEVPARVAARTDSLREAYVLRFLQGQELAGRLPGRTLGLVYFEAGATTLNAAGRARLDALAARVRRLPAGARLRVEGHTDATPITGSGAPNNRVLSAERAAAVARYLAERTGLNPARFETAGFGADQPLVPNDTPEGRRINRRVRVAVVE